MKTTNNEYIHHDYGGISDKSVPHFTRPHLRFNHDGGPIRCASREQTAFSGSYRRGDSDDCRHR
jgi:hypothetical protein